MSRIPRPYIPIHVRLQVAARQCESKIGVTPFTVEPARRGDLSKQLKTLLTMLFDKTPYHLDHDPPLAARQRYADTTGIHYEPEANDPKFLVYRTAENHRIKTLVRGEHGQHPDRVLIKKARRLERPRRKKAKRRRPKRRWSRTADDKIGRLVRARATADDLRRHIGLPPKKRKRRWPSRPFPKGRKLRSRT